MAFDDGSLFGDFDVASAADDPFAVPDGTYAGTITDFKRVESARQDGTAFAFIGVGLKADNGMATDYRLFLPGQGDTEAQIARKRTSMKVFLSGLEVPVEKMNSIRKDDLIGMRVVFTIASVVTKAGGKFKNFTFKRERGSSVTSPVRHEPSGMDEFTQAAGKDTAVDDFGL